MTKQSKILILLISVAVLAVAVYGLTRTRSQISFDAKITLPGTNVTVAYPKQGFNGKGVTLGNSKEAPLMIFEKVANLYVVSKPDGIPQVDVDVYRLEKEKTLEEAVARIAKEQDPEIVSGRYQVINGIRYFVVTDSGADSASAYTLTNGRLVYVALRGGVPDLFVQVLSHVDFTCASDCSVNADPVIDMGKQGEE